MRIFYLFASRAVYVVTILVCSRAIHEYHHLGPDADMFFLSKISVGQFNFVSFLFPHEVHKIRNDAMWDVCFICEASERTAIMFCVWERPLLPVLRVLGLLVCAKNIIQSLRKHKWNLLFSSKRFTFGYFVRGSEQWQKLVCLITD